MHGNDSGDIETTRSSLKTALFSLVEVRSRLDVEQERQRLGELMDLLMDLMSTNKLSLARKVMGTQVCMRARGLTLRDKESPAHG
jgi:hypothetical protein